jgi:hypothetical protein
VLASAEAERVFYAQRDWRRERAGSLASLNQAAVSKALGVLEGLVSGGIESSRWEHHTQQGIMAGATVLHMTAGQQRWHADIRKALPGVLSFHARRHV